MNEAMQVLHKVAALIKIQEDRLSNADHSLNSLYAALRWQQAIGRPANSKELTIKILINLMAVLVTIRNLVILFFPRISEWTREYVMGNILETLGYNNSRMFYMTAVTFGPALFLAQILFEIAEYGGRKEFLDDVFGLEQRMPNWKLTQGEEKLLRQKTVVLVTLCRWMAGSGVTVAVMLVFAAFVLRIHYSHTFLQYTIALTWFVILSVYTYRLTTVFFSTLTIFAVSVISINARFDSLNSRLLSAQTEQDLISFMKGHNEVSIVCKQYNNTFRWMILTFNNLSAPAVAAGIYNVVYGKFEGRWDFLIAVGFSFMVTSCTIMSIFIPSNTTHVAQASYTLLMASTVKIRMSFWTRIRLLTFCKRLSTSHLPGEIGFSNGKAGTFTQVTAGGFLLNLMGMWFMYAGMRQNA